MVKDSASSCVKRGSESKSSLKFSRFKILWHVVDFSFASGNIQMKEKTVNVPPSLKFRQGWALGWQVFLHAITNTLPVSGVRSYTGKIWTLIEYSHTCPFIKSLIKKLIRKQESSTDITCFTYDWAGQVQHNVTSFVHQTGNYLYINPTSAVALLILQLHGLLSLIFHFLSV